MKKCTKCNETKEYNKFSKNKSKPDGYQSMCKACKREYNKKYYKRTKGEYKEQRAESRRKNVAKNQKWLFDYLSDRACADCGESDILTLEFDHLPEYDKEANVASLITCSINALKSEIAKCEVVCANCHKRRTYNRMDSCWRVDLGL